MVLLDNFRRKRTLSVVKRFLGMNHNEENQSTEVDRSPLTLHRFEAMAWAFGSADLGSAARVGLEIYPAALRGRLPGGDGAQPNRRFP